MADKRVIAGNRPNRAACSRLQRVSDRSDPGDAAGSRTCGIRDASVESRRMNDGWSIQALLRRSPRIGAAPCRRSRSPLPPDCSARKWTGALEARLRRAPLEQFLLTGSLKRAGAGAAQTTDNLTRATVFIVEAGLQAYCNEKDQGLATAQLAIVGHIACLVCRAAAAVIQEPATWRVPALVSTTLVESVDRLKCRSH
jgi:hypothetical protein